MVSSSQDAQASSPRDDAIRLLARREYSRAELASRLAAKGHASQAIGECLDTLVAEGLQSDRRFAEHFIRSRIARGQGPVKIHAEFGQRGVEREWIDAALAEADVDWRELACETLAKRFSGPGEGPRDRARRERFLAGRGFDFEQVRYALAHAWDDEP
ncbi:regulatory protein RecX [Aidingimonas halophila]|uniref:Regulatory protein RecX n=1 Tax=Aidingimonas halophila TaxID=574349 RepID=A0A1H2VBR5_9GAMM|nr:regulatory protein RecX [Aidingimonas halophila]GHC24062.1 regulatory protein RecX [Aidingimonas halophila]SDW65733.1 regulatory protein [Aidingimonas halophila]